MYAMMTCCPDIAYSVTTLSKFSTAPSLHHYRLLQTIAKYLKSTIDWGICFKRPKPLHIKESKYKDEINLKKGGFSQTKSYSLPKDPTLEHVFDMNIDAPVLHCNVVDAFPTSDL